MRRKVFSLCFIAASMAATASSSIIYRAGITGLPYHARSAAAPLINIDFSASFRLRSESKAQELSGSLVAYSYIVGRYRHSRFDLIGTPSNADY
jgi:hypothetical protein